MAKLFRSAGTDLLLRFQNMKRVQLPNNFAGDAGKTGQCAWAAPSLPVIRRQQRLCGAVVAFYDGAFLRPPVWLKGVAIFAPYSSISHPDRRTDGEPREA